MFWIYLLIYVLESLEFTNNKLYLPNAPACILTDVDFFCEIFGEISVCLLCFAPNVYFQDFNCFWFVCTNSIFKVATLKIIQRIEHIASEFHEIMLAGDFVRNKFIVSLDVWLVAPSCWKHVSSYHTISYNRPKNVVNMSRYCNPSTVRAFLAASSKKNEPTTQ